MTVPVVLADANVLFSRTLRDYVLYAADEGIIEVHWSQSVLDEVSRNLTAKLGIAPADTQRLERLMGEFFVDALVTVSASEFATVVVASVDPGDAHVLAAAIAAGADLLATDNVRHFPRAWMSEHGITLLTARELLARLVRDAPEVISVVHARTERYSPKSEAEVLATLDVIVGGGGRNPIRSLLGGEYQLRWHHPGSSREVCPLGAGRPVRPRSGARHSAG